MPLIDHTFFIGEINIPGTTEDTIAERIAFFIQSYEEKLLRDILGYPLWKAFNAGIAQASPDQKWIDIRDGKEYTGLDSYLHKWDGLVIKKASTTLKKSLIANYVYWMWQKDNVSQTVTIGEVSTKAENSTVITPKFKMIAAWNQMVDWICELHCFLNANLATYPEWELRNNWFQMRNYRKQNAFDI
jgi:hypothetical protein